MLAEGIKPALIENAAKMAGMSVGLLPQFDEVSLELSWKIVQQVHADGLANSILYGEHDRNPVDLWAHESAWRNPYPASGSSLCCRSGPLRRCLHQIERYLRYSGVGF